MPLMPALLSRWLTAINSGDLDTLVELMTPGHTFFVAGEKPTVGRMANRHAWRGYFAAFPRYKIIIDEVFNAGLVIYLVGHTFGSHVAAEIESHPSSVIWQAVLADNKVAKWIIFAATPAKRQAFGLSI